MSSGKTIRIKLKVWRQSSQSTTGAFKDYELDAVSTDMSFLEMLDTLNQKLIHKGEDPVAFDHDCREGICGSCSVTINGNPHGPDTGTATCQLHMRRFKDGETIVVEPWRARSFPVQKDLTVDRSAFDRIISAGGYISVNTNSTPDGNAIPVPKENADYAFNAATCIGCGACVAVCKNASASLFVAAKISQFAVLPQGQAERRQRALRMVAQMDAEGFGSCSNTGSCSAACPKGISLETIARMNREYVFASILKKPDGNDSGGVG